MLAPLTALVRSCAAVPLSWRRGRKPSPQRCSTSDEPQEDEQDPAQVCSMSQG